MSQTFKWMLRFPAKCVTCGGDMPKGDWCWRDPELGRGKQFWHLACGAPANAGATSQLSTPVNGVRSVVSSGGGIFSTADGGVFLTCSANGCMCHKVGGTFVGDTHADGANLRTAPQSTIDAASAAYQAAHPAPYRRTFRKTLPPPGPSGGGQGDPVNGQSAPAQDPSGGQASGDADQDAQDSGDADQDAQGQADQDSGDAGEGQDDGKGQGQSSAPPPPDDPFTALIKKIAGGMDAAMADKLRADFKRETKRIAAQVAQHMTPPAPPPVTVRLETPDGKAITVDGEHKCLKHLITYIHSGEHVWLVGPKGTGKSHSARVARDKLNELKGSDLPFYSMSVGPQSIQSDFFGFMFPDGKVYRTKFREWFEFGGVFCLDEIDAGSADVLTSLNSALSNGWAMFPDGMVHIHETSVMVATANTDGSGRTELYAGRTQQDGALIDRFAFLDWPIDESLEDKLVPNKAWLQYVRDARKAVATVNQAEISMRAALKGAKDLASGLPPEIVIRARVSKGLSPEAMDVLRQVPVPKALQ